MRIYFIGQKGIPANSGGVERHVEQLAIRLAAMGHEVFVYVRSYYTSKEITQYKGVKLIHLPTLRTKHLDAIFHTFLATLHVLFQKADIIHYQAIGPSLMLWLPLIFKPKARILSTFHSDDRQHQKWGKFAQLMLGLGAYVSVKLAHRCIAISKTQSDIHSQEFNRQMVYIPNGVNVQEKVEANIIKEKWGLDKGEYILAVSRLIRHKGLQYLIRAYLGLKDKAGKKLVIVGDASFTNDYVKYLKNLAAKDSDIIFTGEQSGQVLAELYSNAYLFVQPSEYEGLSIALLEAMSYGLPVLVSDIEGNLEAVDGIGLSFKNKNISDLHFKLKYLLANPNVCEVMKDTLINRVKKEYDWDNIARQTVKLYESVIAERNEKKLLAKAAVKSA